MGGPLDRAGRPLLQQLHAAQSLVRLVLLHALGTDNSSTRQPERAAADSTPAEGDSLMQELFMRPLVRLQVALHELREREDGQTTTEYAILLGFLAIAIIIALFFLRNVLRQLFSDAAGSVSNAPG